MDALEANTMGVRIRNTIRWMKEIKRKALRKKENKIKAEVIFLVDFFLPCNPSPAVKKKCSRAAGGLGVHLRHVGP